MPGWLLRLLPQAGIALAVICTLWWADHAGYRRAMTDRDLHDARMLDRIRTELRASERRLGLSIQGAEAPYQRQRVALGRAGAMLQPTILKEIADAPRLSDPAAGLSPGLLDALNRARASGACATLSPGRIDCALPAAPTGAGPLDR